MTENAEVSKEVLDLSAENANAGGDVDGDPDGESGDIVEILLAPKDIALNPKFVALRSNRTDKEYLSGIKRLASQLKEPSGQKQAVTIRMNSTGTEQSYELVAGHRRYEAAILAGVDLRCVFDDMSDEKAIQWARRENFSREDFSPMEKAKIIVGMRLEKMGTGEIAKELGVSPATVTQTEKLLMLPEEVQSAVEEQRITPSAALEVAPVKAEKREEVIKGAGKAAKEEAAKLEANAKKSGKTLTKTEEKKVAAAKEGKPKVEGKHIRKAIRETEGAVEKNKAPNRASIIDMCENQTGPGQSKPISDFFTVMIAWIKGDVTDRHFKATVDDLAETIKVTNQDTELPVAAKMREAEEKEAAKVQAEKDKLKAAKATAKKAERAAANPPKLVKVKAKLAKAATKKIASKPSAATHKKATAPKRAKAKAAAKGEGGKRAKAGKK